MKFITGKRAQPTVPIISLIDILAILLIFFIATTTFKRKEALVKLSLPKSTELASSSEKLTRTTLAVTKDEEIFPTPIPRHSMPPYHDWKSCLKPCSCPSPV